MLGHLTNQDFPVLLGFTIAGGAVGATLGASWILRALQRRRDRSSAAR